MKRFRFSLERVLRLRSQETEQAKRALGAAIAAEEAARQVAEAARFALVQSTAGVHARERAGLTPFEFGSLRLHIVALQRRLEAAEAELTGAQALTRQRRQELMVARKKERALEKLRERRLEQHTLESLREEQKELDEYGKRLGLNGGRAATDI